MLAINSISNWEGISNALINSTSDSAAQNAITLLRDERIAESMANITSSQLFIFGCIIIGVILVSMAAAYFLLHFGFKVDEKMEAQIVKDLADRHAADEKAALATEGEAK